jgi:hypothetical protein
MSDDDEFRRVAEIERAANGKPSYLKNKISFQMLAETFAQQCNGAQGRGTSEGQNLVIVLLLMCQPAMAGPWPLIVNWPG